MRADDPFHAAPTPDEAARAAYRRAGVVNAARHRRTVRRAAPVGALAVVAVAAAVVTQVRPGAPTSTVRVGGRGAASPAATSPSTTSPSTTLPPDNPPATSPPTTPAPTTAPPVTAPATTSTIPPYPLRSVDWGTVVAPRLGCGSTLQGPVGPRLLQVSYPVTVAGGPEVAVVLASCDSGAGTPPVSLLVYDRATSPTQAHLLQSLLPPGDQASGFTAAGGALAITVASRSSAGVPSCCPDVHQALRWTWAGGSYSPS